MKKIVFATALAIGSMSLGMATTPIFHDGIMEEVFFQDYKEIAAADVPDAVMDALKSDFPGVTLSKAFVNEEGHYKLEVSAEDGSTMDLYADAEGNWLEM